LGFLVSYAQTPLFVVGLNFLYKKTDLQRIEPVEFEHNYTLCPEKVDYRPIFGTDFAKCWSNSVKFNLSEFLAKPLSLIEHADEYQFQVNTAVNRQQLDRSMTLLYGHS